MYTAKSVGKSIENGILSVTVEYTNGSDTFLETYQANSGTDPQWLENRVRNRLLSANTLADFSASLKLGTIAPKDVSQSPDVLWSLEYDKLKKLEVAYSQGLIQVDDPDLIKQRDIVESSFDKSYVKYLRE